MPDIAPMIAGQSNGSQMCTVFDIYTEDGQLGLPITPEMLLSG